MYCCRIVIKLVLIISMINAPTLSKAQLNSLFTLRVEDVLNNPEYVVASGNITVQKELYSPRQIELSTKINNEQVEYVMTYAPQLQSSIWNEIDYEPITPYTWQWVSLELFDSRNKKSVLTLRRPTWWLRQNHAEKIGDKVWIDIDEFGIEGLATITQLYPSQLDTRFWNDHRQGDYVCQPITGKFEHFSDSVYKLYLETGNEISVTGNHPLWSYDREEWVEVSELRIGENITCRYGKTTLIKATKLEGTHKVYNIEVYRSHNYFASDASIMAHNGPCGIDFASPYWSKLTEKSYRQPVRLNGVYIAYIATDRVGDDYNVLLFSIESLRKSNPSGTFTGAMDILIEGARRSGATNINFVVSTIIDPKMLAYFKTFTQRYSGLTMSVNASGNTFGFQGKIDEVQRLHTVIDR